MMMEQDDVRDAAISDMNVQAQVRFYRNEAEVEASHGACC